MRQLGRDYPSGIFYRRACEMMGIDPDNNPNYKESYRGKQLYDVAGNPIKVTVSKPNGLISMPELFETICQKLQETN